MVNEFVEVTAPQRIALRRRQAGHEFELWMHYEAVGPAETRLRWRMRFDDAGEATRVRPFVSEANAQNFDRLEALLVVPPGRASRSAPPADQRLVKRIRSFAIAALMTAGVVSCERSTPARLEKGGAAETPTQPSVLPAFRAYAVADTFRGRPAPVDLTSDPEAREFRTVLRAGAATGPNFAGRFTIVTWGCGAGCQLSAVVDGRTGRVYGDWVQTSMAVAYERGSALVIADPPDSAHAAFGDVPPDQCFACGTPAAYVWRADHFEPVGRGNHPHLLPAAERLR